MMMVVALHVAGIVIFANATNFRFVQPVLTVLHVNLIPPTPPKHEEVPLVAVSTSFPLTTIIEPVPPEIKIQTPQVRSPIQVPPRKVESQAPLPTTSELTGPITPPLRISSPHSSDRYPAKSVKNRESGRTELKICISSAGTVDTAEVVKTSGYPELDKAAVDMALDTRFKPATQMDKPIVYCMTTGIRFRLH
jgi:protein TonB